MASSSPRPSRMTSGERREQLLDVTHSLVLERGFHAISIEAVARKAGISRPIVYGHFRDLDGLLEALVEREAERALGQLDEVLAADVADGDPAELLVASLAAYLRAVEARPATWRLVLMPPEGAPVLLRKAIARGRAAVIAQLAAGVRAGAELVPGRDSPDPELTARLMSSAADEAARLLLTDPEGYPAQRLLAHARWLLGELL